jgi:hypothetical protein
VRAKDVSTFESNIFRAMKQPVKSLIKSPSAFIIIILLFLLILLFSVKAITKGDEAVIKIDEGQSTSNVEYSLAP